MLFLLDANMPYSAKDLFVNPHKALHVRDIKRVLGNFLKKIDFASIPKSTIIAEEARFRIKK